MIYGADISMIDEVESRGGSYRGFDGEDADLFAVLRTGGVNLIRLRLWLDPKDADGNSYGGGDNDLARTLTLAQRAKDAGHQFMLDFHYSDFWTDPKKQMTPKAWAHLSFDELVAQVEQYTEETLRTLEAAGLLPDYVQVGNEITNGMLWPLGKTAHFDFENRQYGPIDDEQDDRLAALVNAGTAGVKKVADIPVILHLDFGGDNGLYRSWFDRMTARGVKPEIIGLSYYPFWHGTLTELRDNLHDIAERYNAGVMVVETAFPHTMKAAPNGHDNIVTDLMVADTGFAGTVDGQSGFLRELYRILAEVPQGRGLGVVYWEPAWLPVPGTSWANPAGMEYGNDFGPGGNGWGNLGVFDYEGRALESLKALGGQ